MTIHASGQAIRLASKTSLTNSFESNPVTLAIDAPKTFRIPISLVRNRAEKEARPKRPRQEMRIANPVKTPKSEANC